MIQLQKRAKPEVLARNEGQWTAELMQYVQRDEKPPARVTRRYNHDVIKAVLSQETHDKCAYCESKLPHNAYGDVEHMGKERD